MLYPHGKPKRFLEVTRFCGADLSLKRRSCLKDWIEANCGPGVIIGIYIMLLDREIVRMMFWGREIVLYVIMGIYMMYYNVMLLCCYVGCTM
jgi:hypothetical protein